MGPLLLALLIVANLFGVGMIVPQVVRLHRTRVAEGVSAVWVGTSLAINFWWLAYGVNGHLWGLVPVSIGGMVVYGVVVSQVRSVVGSPILRPIAISATGLFLVLLAILGIAGWSAVGLTLGLAYSVQFTPAALNVLRSNTAAGVSPLTWIMAATEAAIWIVYGLASADRGLIVGGAGGTLAACAILVGLFLRRPSEVPARRPALAL